MSCVKPTHQVKAASHSKDTLCPIESNINYMLRKLTNETERTDEFDN